MSDSKSSDKVNKNKAAEASAVKKAAKKLGIKASIETLAEKQAAETTGSILKEMGAIVLAGGKSSRMGRDKSAVLLEGEPLLLRAVRSLQHLFADVVVVANQEIPFDVPGVKIVRDEIPHQGPLGGIDAGLKASSHEINFVMAVDMPFASPQVIECLASFTGKPGKIDEAGEADNGIDKAGEVDNAQGEDRIDEAIGASEACSAGNTGKADTPNNVAETVDAVVPLAAHGLEPLFAFYNKRCLPAIKTVLGQGERKILAAFALLDVRVVGYNELRDLEGADRVFSNINTERDLEEAEARSRSLKHGDTGVVAGAKDNDDGYDIRMPKERATTIYVNSEELVTVQSSLQHLDELACGFLVSEGILQDREELEFVRVNEDRGEVRIRIKGERSRARTSMGKRFVTSGCGKGFSFVSLGDAMGMAKLTSDYAVPAVQIPILMKEFLREGGKPGMHSSAVVRGREIVFTRQDIGRHNTVDMILGKLWLDRDVDRDIMLFTSGRISYEMMVKAGKARIPIVVSRTAATDLAVTLAKRLNIELIGYVRAGNMHLYTDGRRLH